MVMIKCKTLERFIFLHMQISKSRGCKGLPWAMDQNKEMGCIHLLVYTNQRLLQRWICKQKNGTGSSVLYEHPIACHKRFLNRVKAQPLFIGRTCATTFHQQ